MPITHIYGRKPWTDQWQGICNECEYIHVRPRSEMTSERREKAISLSGPNYVYRDEWTYEVGEAPCPKCQAPITYRERTEQELSSL